jgi:hypothetical protein
MKKTSLIISSSLLGVCAGASLAFAEVNQPQEITMRPLTTPGGQLTIGGDVGILLIPDVDTIMALGIGGSYGVDDKIEVGASYAFLLAPEFEAKGALGVEAAYNIMEGNLSVAADVATGYDLLAEEMNDLELGARVRFRLNDQLAINSRGGQLNIALAGDPKPITLDLPVGVSYQVSPQIYGFLDTNLASISISNSETVVFGADFIPLQVGAFFSPSNMMDFGAAIGWGDLKESSDVIAITVSARLHM